MITGTDAERVMGAIKSLDAISENEAIALVEADLMGIPVHVLAGATKQPFGSEGAIVGIHPIAVLCSPAIAKRLRIAGHEPDSGVPNVMPVIEGRA